VEDCGEAVDLVVGEGGVGAGGQAVGAVLDGLVALAAGVGQGAVGIQPAPAGQALGS
jgi:hypothetical protein